MFPLKRKSMRVGVACNKLGYSGGMEQYALRIIEALQRMGHTPVVFTMQVDSSLPISQQIEVHVCPNLYRWLPHKLNVVRFNHWIKNTREIVPVDFMISCCLAITAEIATCGGTRLGFLSAMHRSPVVIDNWIINLEKEMYSNARLVVAHSMQMRAELQTLYRVNPKRISVIYPPRTFISPSYKKNRLQLRREWNLPEDRTLFLFPSSSHRRKGIALLRRYFENTPYAELLVVAGRSLEYPFKNSRYVGFCRDMPELYRACDYTVLASSYEPLGMVGAESVCCGTPAIMGSNIGCCEILDSRAVMKFDVNSDEDFARKMAIVRNGPMHLSPPYQQYVSKLANLTAEEHVFEMLELYKQTKLTSRLK